MPRSASPARSAQGVKIAFGTDTGVSPSTATMREEFALMVKAGMAPAAAIQSATVNAADLLGKSATIGTIEPGKDADIIAVDGDPTGQHPPARECRLRDEARPRPQARRPARS